MSFDASRPVAESLMLLTDAGHDLIAELIADAYVRAGLDRKTRLVEAACVLADAAGTAQTAAMALSDTEPADEEEITDEVREQWRQLNIEAAAYQERLQASGRDHTVPFHGRHGDAEQRLRQLHRQLHSREDLLKRHGGWDPQHGSKTIERAAVDALDTMGRRLANLPYFRMGS